MTLMKYLKKELKNNGYINIIQTKDYIFAEGDLPICLLAHCDTVFNQLPSEWIYDKRKEVLWSPDGAGFDDRVGILIILNLINMGFKPTIIFTTGEEVGGMGAFRLIADFPEYPFQIKPKFLLQLDRRGKSDCVFYDCNNKKFIKKIEHYGFKTAEGLFTDISIIAPIWEIAAVNLSVGYYDEHTKAERVYLKETRGTLRKVVNILTDIDKLPCYKYIPIKKNNFFNKKQKNKCHWCGLEVDDIDTTWYQGNIFDFPVPLCPHCAKFAKI